MKNFSYFCPTRIVFGKDSLNKLASLLPKDKKIILIYGKGSIKKNGIYDQVKTTLRDFNYCEFEGIEANPKFETCMKAAEFIKEQNAQFILSVGGGSVLDGCKFISVATHFEGDPWDILSKNAAPKSAIEIGCVMTLPATGSEMNSGAVISKLETNEKLSFKTDITFPKFSIIDPTFTYSLPQRQLTNGLVDSFVHTMEQYCTIDINTMIQDEFALGILKTLVALSPNIKEGNNDYNTRANFCWSSTVALNNWIRVGVIEDWATHMIGHELTAFYGIDHAQSLAIVMPRVLEFNLELKKAKLAKLGRDVFGLSGDEDEVAKAAILKVREFFESCEMKCDLSDYGIDKIEASKKVSQRFLDRDVKIGENGSIDYKAIEKILLNC